MGNRLKTIVRALRYPRFRAFFIWQTVSYIGTWMQQIAMVWLIYRLTNSPFMLGVMGFFSQVPSFFLSPYAGVLTDRYDKRYILIATQILFIIVGGFFSYIVLTNHMQLWLLLTLALCFGIINAFDTPSRQAFFLHLIDDRKDLPNAIALNSVMFHASRFIGPALAGFVIKFVGEGYCFLLNALSFVPILLLLLVLPSRHIKKPLTGTRRAFFIEGFRYVVSQAHLMALLQLVLMISLFGMSYMTLAPVMVKTVFHADAVLLGYFMSAAGIGAMLGALYIAAHERVYSLAPHMYLASLSLGLALVILALSPWVALSLAVMSIIGFSMMMQVGASNVSLQALAEDAYRGRVISFYAMAFGGMVPFGNLLTGACAHFIGAPWTLIICGGICIGAGQIFLRSVPIIQSRANAV